MFDVDAAHLPGRLTAVAAALGERLTTAAPIARRAPPRPAAGRRSTWSATSATSSSCGAAPIVRVLVEDRPSFPPMHRDERAALERYAEQRPATVAADVGVAARLLGGVLTGRSAAELDRPCVYNYPEPTERSLVWIGRNALHEGEHHLLDVHRAPARAARPTRGLDRRRRAGAGIGRGADVPPRAGSGLLGRDGLEGALVLDKTKWVHTLAMRFPLMSRTSTATVWS